MAGKTLGFALHAKNGASQRRDLPIERCVIAGWTGRNKTALQAHIAELEALGVKRPASTPIFYRVAAARLTVDHDIEAVGDSSGGEVEFVLVQHGGALWVGVGSDHTDRSVEAYGVTVSKQMCDKPVAPELWRLEDVADHWDHLLLRSFVVAGGKRELYQEGLVSAMLDPADLIAQYSNNGGLEDGTLMFGGTLAVHGGVRATPQFEFELEDPVRDRKISHGYAVKTLPVLG